MSTLPDRPRTALLVIDVQRGVVADAHDRDAVVGNIQQLVDRARNQRTPVVWVQHSSEELPIGSEPWEYVPELEPGPQEPIVAKQWPDSFEDTNLEEILSGLSVGHLVVAGAQTDECVRSTLHGAIVRGYDATLVEDAHTTQDFSQWGAPTPDKVIAHTNLYWKFHAAPGRQGGTLSTAEVTFDRA